MPRSTRHKSSKHKDSRDYSDSEKESSLKERKSKDETSARVSKDSGSGDKRKLESSKDYNDDDYYEEYSSSKRRKGKTGDDRLNGKDDEKGESSKKSSEKSRRREDPDGEKTKKSSGRSDGKHRESSRRDTKESDKDRKHKESKSDKFYDGDDHHHKSKAASDRTESKYQDHVKSPGSENHVEKRSRRKKDEHNSGDKHQDNSDDIGDRLFGSGEGKQKGEKSKEKFQEDKEEDIKEKGDKQKDDRHDKLLRNESKKKSKVEDNDHSHEPDSEFDGYHDRERNRDYERESDRNERTRERARDRDRDYERNRERDRRDYEHDRYHEREWEGERSRDRDRDYDRDRTHDREKDRDYYHDKKRSKSDRERDNDPDVSRRDDESGRYKERSDGRRSPDYQDYQEAILGPRSSRAGTDGDMIKSDRQPENGNVMDQITKGVSSKVAELSGRSERDPRHQVSEKTATMEDGVSRDFPAERSSAAKASPRSMVERSPSSTSLDRRYNNRSEREETGHRNNVRDERHLVSETSQGELSYNNKANQNNPSFPPRPESRSGISSPRVGPREEDNRANTGGRYKRGGDGMMGRGQGNVWRGVPSWPSPLPNGFIPFPHVPPPGGFQNMMPQFPSPSLFGVRPSMEMSHSGITYHIPDSERFSGHMRPLGWQNMMDGSGASHMQGFFADVSNGVFRDDSTMPGGSEWDHSRRMHGRGWESGADEWRNRNGDTSMEIPSTSVKDDNSAQVGDDGSFGDQTSNSENKRGKSIEAGSNLTSPAKELHASSPKTMGEDSVTEPTDISERYCRHYLSKLDISIELAGPELQECISLVMGEEHSTLDDRAAVFLNLKEGGKRVPKSNSTSSTSLPLFSSQNISVFQIAMDLYKEQRFEVNGLPNVKSQGTPQVSLPHLVKFESNDNVSEAMEGNSPIQTSDVKIADVSDSEKEVQKVSLHVGAEMEMETQEEGSSSPNAGKSPEVLEAVVSDHTEECEQEAEPGDGAGVVETTERGHEHDGDPEGGDHADTSIIAAPELVAMEVCEQNNSSEGASMEGTEEKKEEADGDGDGEEGVKVVGDVTREVTEPLVNESDESVVISRIHLSPQSTH